MCAPSVSFHPNLIILPNPTRPRSISSQDSNVIDYLRRPHRNSIALNSIRPSLLGAIEFRDVVNSLTRESSYNPAHDSVSFAQRWCQNSNIYVEFCLFFYLV
ncbi:hypothetical protein O181_052116 [Austropuccinia psidii MF-1]|uniref:Uncharacterized protein n=1 Tax=Austropuccinia psidii MF-1 TaxID=1389203 RepID=A0A9Q3DXQ4_9BASI|nr:hypothetical protein [Austropuccinia psidii MF-1]